MKKSKYIEIFIIIYNMSNKGKLKRKVIRLIIIGDSIVGKTAICRAFFDYEIDLDDFIGTIGMDNFEKKIQMEDGNEIKLIIWDTSGSEMFHYFAIRQCQSAQGILVCFDLTQRSTFNRIKLWLDDIDNLSINIPIVLLGNKSDMIDNREITEKEAKEFAEKCSLPYFETSVKDRTNIKEAVLFLSNTIYKENKYYSIGKNKRYSSVYKNKNDSNNKSFSLNKLFKFYCY